MTRSARIVRREDKFDLLAISMLYLMLPKPLID